MNILEKTTFIKDIDYLVNIPIYEYDISKANINILYKYNMLDDYNYNRLMNAPRNVRQKEIGIMILKNSKIYSIINNGIKEMRSKFMEMNNLTDEDILSVKNDALFVIDKVPLVTKFDNIEFRLRNTYSSFCKANGLELYYAVDRSNSKDFLDVKGISDSKLINHENYIIDFIKTLFYEIQTDINTAILMIRHFYRQYIDFELDINYYRCFDSISMFKVIIGDKYYDVDMANDYSCLDISCNLNLIRDLWQVVTHIQLGI